MSAGIASIIGDKNLGTWEPYLGVAGAHQLPTTIPNLTVVVYTMPEGALAECLVRVGDHPFGMEGDCPRGSAVEALARNLTACWVTTWGK